MYLDAAGCNRNGTFGARPRAFQASHRALARAPRRSAHRSSDDFSNWLPSVNIEPSAARHFQFARIESELM